MPSNLWALVEPSLKKHRHKSAWICRGKNTKRIVSYKQLYKATLTIANTLRGMGIGPQDTVGISAPNGPEWTAAALACWKLGANIAPVHIGNSDHDIEIQLKAVSPKLMLVHESSTHYPNSMEISMQEDENAIAAESAIAIPGTANDVAVRIYTSGSTGTPKVVRLSHSNHASNVIAACKIENFTANDRFISLLPFSHAMGLTANLLLPIYRGSTVVAPRVLAANEILSTLAEEKVSVVIAVPRLFRSVMLGLEKKFEAAGTGMKIYLSIIRNSPLFLRRFLNAPLRKKFGGHITAWVSGGSHLDGEISKYYHALGLPLRQGYGLTETSPLTSVQRNFDSAVESVGKPIDKVKVKLHNPDSQGNGEILIKGPNVMLGYEDEEQNSQAFIDGWYKSGDIAQIDEQGRIKLTGRSKRLIVTEAGKNVYPEEIETLLERDHNIKEAGVFELDMKPAAILALDMEQPIEQAKHTLKEFNKLVSPHSQISRFAIVEELPKTPLGKVALQELASVFEKNEIR